MSHLRQGYGAQAPCTIQESGSIELFFYDELPPAERAQVSDHLRHCRECALALEDLQMIREALASRPDVSAPPAGDWSGFMTRLNTVLHAERPAATVVPFRELARRGFSEGGEATRRWVGLLATAALLAIVTLGVYFVAQQASRLQPGSSLAKQSLPGTDGAVATTGIRAAGEKHFERSKLVVLGLANRETDVTSEDWAYERELAAALLDDTRVYRMAAEQHGMTTLAGIMRDLELVLLETSMADGVDRAELGQIQRLIQKRNLIEKMDTVASAGM